MCGPNYLGGCTFYVGDKPIEFVDSLSHFDITSRTSILDDSDILIQRGDSISPVNKMGCVIF